MQPPANPATPYNQGVRSVLHSLFVEPVKQAGDALRGKMTDAEAQDFMFGAAAGLLPMGRGLRAAKGIRAYHGSPHDFDRFDMSKIGTGEGAQAYGHGLYFAENPKTAEFYRDNLSDMRLNGQPYNINDPIHQAAAILDRHSGSRPKAIGEAWQALQRDPVDPMNQQVYRLLDSDRELPKFGERGKMYEVNINASPEQFLDWDAPLSKQPAAVHGLLGSRDVGVSRTFGPADPTLDSLRTDPKWKGRWDSQADEDRVWAHMRKLYPDYSDNQLSQIANEVYASVSGGKIPQSATGSRLYDVLAQRLGASKPEATQALAEAGIPGIKYLDQGSRAAGEGGRNYVVFDDKLIDILRKYGLAGLMTAPAVTASQGPLEQLMSPQQ